MCFFFVTLYHPSIMRGIILQHITLFVCLFIFHIFYGRRCDICFLLCQYFSKYPPNRMWSVWFLQCVGIPVNYLTVSLLFLLVVNLFFLTWLGHFGLAFNTHKTSDFFFLAFFLPSLGYARFMNYCPIMIYMYMLLRLTHKTETDS